MHTAIEQDVYMIGWENLFAKYFFKFLNHMSRSESKRVFKS